MARTSKKKAAKAKPTTTDTEAREVRRIMRQFGIAVERRNGALCILVDHGNTPTKDMARVKAAARRGLV